MKDNSNKPLTPSEIAKLLGADEYECIGDISMDPIGLLGFASEVGKRLTSKGGRPTDESWKISRKVPMKKETWLKLETLSNDLGKQKVRVAAGQLAAIALEQGLSSLTEKKEDVSVLVKKEFSRDCSYSFPEEECEEARELVGAIPVEGIWS